MKYEVKIPKVGESIEEVAISQWNKQVGDYVEKGEILFEVEAEKATVEVEADSSGYVREVLFGEGESVAVGETVAYISDTAEE